MVRKAALGLSGAMFDVAGRFKCDKCQQTTVVAVEYFLILLATILLNMFLIWRLLKEDVASWDLVEGSDYVEVYDSPGHDAEPYHAVCTLQQ